MQARKQLHAGMACPVCRSRNDLYVQAIIDVRLEEDGFGVPISSLEDPELHEGGVVTCGMCGSQGRLEDFCPDWYSRAYADSPMGQADAASSRRYYEDEAAQARAEAEAETTAQRLEEANNATIAAIKKWLDSTEGAYWANTKRQRMDAGRWDHPLPGGGERQVPA